MPAAPPALAGAGVLRRHPGHRRAGLRAADLPVRARGARPRGARGDGRGRRERRPDPAPGQRRQGARLRDLHRHRRVGRPGGPDRADRLRAGLQPRPVGEDAGEPDADPGRLRRRAAASPPPSTPPITGVFFGVEIILREFSVDAHVHRHAVGDDRRRGRDPVPRRQAVPAGFPAGHRAASTRRDYLLVAVLAVVAGLIGLLFKNVVYKTEDLWDAGLEEPAGMGPARDRRNRARPDPAGPAADVRGRVPGHVQGRRRSLRRCGSCWSSRPGRSSPAA